MRRLIKIVNTAAFSAFTFITPCLGAEFEGSYIEKKTNNQITITSGEDGSYIVETSAWKCVSFWDAGSKTYRGVFRFKDGIHKREDADYSTGGAEENAVGFHSYELEEDGRVLVTGQWILGDV